MGAEIKALTISELGNRIAAALAAAPGLSDVWVVGETSDLRLSRGHCYMDLIEKDAAGNQIAKMRAMIWARDYGRLSASFEAGTGSPLRSDLKIMVRVKLTYHVLFGLSLTVSDINPEYTVGDMVRRRNEIIKRLQAEGVYDLNRTLSWARPVQRIAIISASGAAGYGDFIRQLYTGSATPLRFSTELFEAALQGTQTSPSVIAALERIAARMDDFDCVVIIRGGGAVADLVSFDDYDLAANVAQFPLPVIVGIGHDRDITVLDYVAAKSARTPTAAAEFLRSLAENELAGIINTGMEIQRLAVAHLRGAHSRLERITGELPSLVRRILDREHLRLDREIAPAIPELAQRAIARSRERLDSLAAMLEALSPEATLRRGYSITRVGGRAITDTSLLGENEIIETILAKGQIFSKALSIQNGNNK